MPTYDSGTSGLTGTVGVTILLLDGTVHVARTTAGITEPVAGSGVYHVAEHDTTADLIYAWDNGEGTVGASEVLYAGRGNAASIAAILEDTGTTLPAAIAATSMRGVGAWPWTPAVKSGGVAVVDAEVTVYRRDTDTVVAGPLYTNLSGECRDAAGAPAFRLDSGAYRTRIVKAGNNLGIFDFTITATGTETRP